MSKIFLQTRTFENPTGDPLRDFNSFLEMKGELVEGVTPLFNNITGGVVYVVTYWTKEKDMKEY